MKKSFFVLLLLAVSFSSLAGTLVITCQVGEDKIEVSKNLADITEPQTLSIYNQGGLGPNFLEASYVSTKGLYQISPSDTLYVESEFPMGGKFQVEFLDTYSENDGSGMITYPNSKTETALKDCQFKIK
jgi:hypothetical protein